ncbi:MAG: glycosyltransferase family 4 protein [Planctomycetales bacterium]|nr:glycosyltransferase family 4 protein [Planctomycetales bacterium]
MPCRLLYILPSHDTCGAADQAALLAAGLPREDFDVQCVRLGEGATGDDLPLRSGIDLAGYFRLKRLLRELRPDIVHLWQSDAEAFARRAAQAVGCRHIVTTQCDAERPATAAGRFADRWLARPASRVIFPSELLRTQGATQGRPIDCSVIIPRGVALPEATGDAAVRCEAELAPLGVPADTCWIAAAGELTAEGDWKQLLWAMALLKEVRSDFHLLYFGDGPQRGRFKQYVQQIQVDEFVTLLPRPWRLEEFLPRAQVFAGVGARDVQPHGMLCAMAAGLPVVASDTPAHRELIDAEKTGFLVDPGDRAALARWIQVLLDDAPRAAQMGTAGRDKAARQFSAQQMVAAHQRLYSELLREIG